MLAVWREGRRQRDAFAGLDYAVGGGRPERHLVKRLEEKENLQRSVCRY